MRDLRLALPVAIAWAVLAVLSAHPALLGAGSVVAACVAGAGLLAAHLMSRRVGVGRLPVGAAPAAVGVAPLPFGAVSAGVVPGLRTLALGAALACPLLVGADAVVASGLDECESLSLLLLGQAAPTEVMVTGCDGGSLASVGAPRSAMLLRVAAESPLTIGGTATGACDAWLDGSRWLLTCTELDAAEPQAWAAWAGPLRDGLLHASAQLPGVGGELLPGLSIGDERRVSAELRTAMLDTGLSHLTAVSGPNC